MKNIFPEIDQAVVVIVDIQERLMVAMDQNKYEPAMAKAVEIFATLGLPCVVTEQYPKGLGSTVASIKSVLPANSRIFEKDSFSCWGSESFCKELNSHSRRNIIIMGMESHICVLQTAIEALQQDYNVIVAVETVCSRSEANKEVALNLLREAGAVITTLEALAFGFMRSSKHPAFKTVAKLFI
jgi:nicotinamidase-related amidase